MSKTTKHKLPDYSRPLRFTPEGGFEVEFYFGSICGRQKSESVGLRTWNWREERWEVHGAILAADVKRLRDFFVAACETMEQTR